MARIVIVGVIVAAVVSLGNPAAKAQDSLLSQLYGQGVHAYFDKEYKDAYHSLTQAIDQGSQDPRCFYFRGLALHHLGRPDEARTDFQKGAEIEAGGSGQFYPISRSLQRVQGNLRIQLEEVRQQAQLTNRARREAIRKARYDSVLKAEAELIRRANLPPARLPEFPAEDDPTLPFATGSDGTGTTPNPPTTTRPDVPPTTNSSGASDPDDPFADPKTADDPVKSGKPVNPPTTTDNAAKPDPTNNATKVDDPFADDPFGDANAKPANDDPFTDDPADKPKKSGEGGSTLRSLLKAFSNALPGGKKDDSDDAGASE